MGMDVYGLRPDDPKGEYFRNTIFWWHELWRYVTTTCGEIMSKNDLQYGHTNDNHRISEDKAILIGVRLKRLIAKGETADYEAMFNAAKDATPDEPCDICGATGKRKVPPECGPGDIPCNGCGGKGMRRPYTTFRYFSVENVKEFAEFCDHCGGFEIC